CTTSPTLSDKSKVTASTPPINVFVACDAQTHRSEIRNENIFEASTPTMAILVLLFSFLVVRSNLYFWIAIIPIVISKTLGGHARRVYVGGFSPAANEQVVATLFSQVMTAVGGNTAGPVDAVVNVYVNHEKFAFVEMRSFEEASNTMSLDGMIFELPRSLCYRYCVRCGVKMGDNTLTVRRANQGITQHQPEQESILLHAQQQIAFQVRGQML
uniref:RRM domain-containing protein n=1 Tax=Brassica oleracea var. oleracea TaxID=109376 RepID=A0A0D3CIV1_BRAOL